MDFTFTAEQENPLHRYFLWAKHNELTLGSATQQLVHLGSTYPEGRL